MKKVILVLVVLSLGLSVQAQKNKTKKKKKKKLELKTETDSISYAVGLMIMKNLQDQGMDTINMKAYIRGAEDWLDSTTKMTSTEANDLATAFFTRKYQEQLEATKLPQLEWLEKNKEKDSVVALPSGLQYKILKQGDGPIPTASNKVKVHYRGSLIDGKVFDSSYDRGEPIEFQVTGVIMGWQEALQLMPQGSVWELYIPFDLAYGENGAGNSIPPYATLIFKVELLEVK